MRNLLSLQRRLLNAFDIVAPHNARVLCACIQSFNSKHADGSVADLENVLFILSGEIQGLHRCMKGRGHVRLRQDRDFSHHGPLQYAGRNQRETSATTVSSMSMIYGACFNCPQSRVLGDETNLSAS